MKLLDHPTDEIQQLRRCVRDLVALSALPAAWTGGDTRSIGESLAEILQRMVPSDLLYIRMTRMAGSSGDAGFEMACVDHQTATEEEAREIGQALAHVGQAGGSASPLSIPNPAGTGTLQVAALPIGIGGDCGVLMAGARRAEFPTEMDRVLLGVAANHAAILLQRNRAEEERSQKLKSEQRLEAELQRRLQQLAEADQRKDEFLAILAHELRNPLAPLRNALHILRVTRTPDRLQEMMERQVQQMVHLVDDLLEVSRITRGKIELRKEPVELASLVRNAIETSGPIIEASRHELTVSLPADPLVLDGDPVRLAQVISNLLNNAAKYTDPGGSIWLTAAREGSEAVVRVRDNGIGIPSDMLPRIFEMFAQVDRSIGRSQGGLGIGLTLVRSLVELHGGSIAASSAGSGHGSEFAVRLPLASSRPDDPVEQSLIRDDQAINVPRLRLLVVDDNEDAAETLGLLLELNGNDVRIAHDGSSALATIGDYKPSVVLLDIGMPGMDGYEVARRVRAQPEWKDLVLIALTGWGQEEDRRRSQEAGFNHHLTKPVDLDILLALLSDLRPADRLQ
jgi:signal transduction histidine kinase/ActR/RegA family two-component response regulator